MDKRATIRMIAQILFEYEKANPNDEVIASFEFRSDKIYSTLEYEYLGKGKIVQHEHQG